MAAMSLAALASTPSVNAHTDPNNAEVNMQKKQMPEFSKSETKVSRSSLFRSRKSRIGGIFRELNQRQTRKLHRQVPQLRKR